LPPRTVRAIQKLLGVFHALGFTNDGDANLPWVLKLILDLAHDRPGEIEGLLIVYGVTAAVCLAFVISGVGFSTNPGALLGWTFAAVLAIGALVVWITIVNFLYLLTQMTIAVEDVGVRDAMRRVAQFIRTSLREVVGIFGVVLLLVAVIVGGGLLASTGLALIAVIPFVGLAMVPLQLAAWMLRGIAFEYLALTALGAYLTQYRYYRHSLATMSVAEPATDVTGPRLA